MLYERALANTRFQFVGVRSVAAATTTIDSLQPAAIVLDLRLQGEESWDLLAKLKRDERTASVPLIVVSTIDDRQKGMALGADAYAIKPIKKDWLLATLDSLVPKPTPVLVLAVDDEEAYRYIVREMLNAPAYQVVEAATGHEGVRLTRDLQPDVVLLDLQLGDMTGLEVYERLREDSKTANVPVIVVTSQRLSTNELRSFGNARSLSKGTLTRDVLRAAIRDVVSASRPTEVHP
jgi:CheY-like chemotaxis protein